ncbi:MAG: hypothetical protein ACE5K0_04125 [Candidatus Methanofastidiosia archaeon]
MIDEDLERTFKIEILGEREREREKSHTSAMLSRYLRINQCLFGRSK